MHRVFVVKYAEFLPTPHAPRANTETRQNAKTAKAPFHEHTTLFQVRRKPVCAFKHAENRPKDAEEGEERQSCDER